MREFPSCTPSRSPRVSTRDGIRAVGIRAAGRKRALQSAPLASTIALALVVGCGGRTAPSEDPPVADATLDAGPLVCSVAIGLFTLRPAATNAGSCRAPTGCRVFAGHGQHISCSEGLVCSIDECICADGEGFTANFATGVVRTGPRCRYELAYD